MTQFVLDNSICGDDIWIFSRFNTFTEICHDAYGIVYLRQGVDGGYCYVSFKRSFWFDEERSTLRAFDKT